MNRLLERDGALAAATGLLDQARQGQAGTLFVLAELLRAWCAQGPEAKESAMSRKVADCRD